MHFTMLLLPPASSDGGSDGKSGPVSVLHAPMHARQKCVSSEMPIVSSPSGTRQYDEEMPGTSLTMGEVWLTTPTCFGTIERGTMERWNNERQYHTHHDSPRHWLATLLTTLAHTTLVSALLIFGRVVTLTKAKSRAPIVWRRLPVADTEPRLIESLSTSQSNAAALSAKCDVCSSAARNPHLMTAPSLSDGPLPWQLWKKW